MLLNLVFFLLLGTLFGSEDVPQVPHPLILTSIHTLNQEWVHINGLGPWSDQLEMSAPESSETFGSRVLITLDGQSGNILLSHCGNAFVGIFRAGDLSVDIMHPAQNVFCAKEEGLPTEEAFDVPIVVRKNDIIFALLPSTAGWAGVKPVDLQGAMYGVEAGDSESFTDFVKNLPKVLKDFNCSLLICVVSDKPKGLCEPCKLMYSRSHQGSFVSFDGTNNSGGITFPFSRAPRPFFPMVFGPPQPLNIDSYEELPMARTNTRRTFTLSSSSSCSDASEHRDSPSPNPLRRTRRLRPMPRSSSSSSGSSSFSSSGDYNYRSPRSSEASSGLSEEDAYVPGQNQESDRRLNTIPGFFTNQAETTLPRPQWIQRRRPAPTQDNFPDLNEPIPTAPFRPPRLTLPVIRRSDEAQPSAGRGTEPSAGRETARIIQVGLSQSNPGSSIEGAGRGTARLTQVGLSTRPARGRFGRATLQQRRAEEEQQQGPQPNGTRVRPREDSDDENERDSKRIRR